MLCTLLLHHLLSDLVFLKDVRLLSWNLKYKFPSDIFSVMFFQNCNKWRCPRSLLIAWKHRTELDICRCLGSMPKQRPGKTMLLIRDMVRGRRRYLTATYHNLHIGIRMLEPQIILLTPIHFYTVDIYKVSGKEPLNYPVAGSLHSVLWHVLLTLSYWSHELSGHESDE